MSQLKELWHMIGFMYVSVVWYEHASRFTYMVYIILTTVCSMNIDREWDTCGQTKRLQMMCVTEFCRKVDFNEIPKSNTEVFYDAV